MVHHNNHWYKWYGFNCTIGDGITYPVQDLAEEKATTRAGSVYETV